MKIAVFPGSFNPFHSGHKEVIEKALKIFDRVIVARGVNPQKAGAPLGWEVKLPKGATYMEFTGLLANFVRNVRADAVIRGLRNAQDLEQETIQQYWCEDLGMEAPIFYIICGRDKRHVSSSAIRAVKKFKK